VHLELTIVAGRAQGEVVSVAAAGLARDEIEPQSACRRNVWWSPPGEAHR